MLDESALHLGLVALAQLDGDPLENLRNTRLVQRTVVRIQIDDVRRHLAHGGSWGEVAAALGIDDVVARTRFEPHLR